MNLELSNPRIFKDAFDCVTRIVDEVKLEFTKEGLTVNALDKSHITFITLNFKYSLFDEYDCEVPEGIIIDTDQFLKILKRCNNNDILKLSTNEGNLILIFEGDATKEYHIRLVDNEYETPNPPHIEYPLQVKVPSLLVKDSLVDLKLFNDNLVFTCDEDYLRLSAEGSFGDSEIKYLHGENVQGMVRAGYSINKLEDIFRASKLSEEVELSFGDDLPLTVNFNLITGDGGISFLLAPRISNEDEI